MKRKNLLLIGLLFSFIFFTNAEAGSRLWLRFVDGAQSTATKPANANGVTADVALNELIHILSSPVFLLLFFFSLWGSALRAKEGQKGLGKTNYKQL